MTMPMNLHPQYITDENGNKTSVILPIEEFDNIQASLRKIQSIDNNSLITLQIDSMKNTWNNNKDKGWDEL